MICCSRSRAILVWLACASLFGPLLSAVDSERVFQFHRWTAENELPSNTVISLLQTRDGYVWVGTRHGLARFDGVRFKVFTDELSIENDRDLSCYDLMEDTAGRLWVRLPAGLVCFDHGRIEKFSTRSGPLKCQIQTAIAARDGGLWLATQGNGLKRFENGRFTLEYTNRAGLASNVIGFLQEDGEGGLWLGHFGWKTTLFQRLDTHTGEVKMLSEILGEAISEVKGFHVDDFRRVWVGTRTELLRWDHDKMSRFPADDFGKLDLGMGAIIDVGGETLWFTPSFTGKLERFQHGRFEKFSMDDGLADTDLRSLLPDREGNLWVGMGVGGLQMIRPRSLVSLLTTNASGGRQQIESAYAGHDGIMWLGAADALLRWEMGAADEFTNSLRFPGRRTSNARAVLEDRNHNVWFGSSDLGLFTLCSNRVTRVTAADRDGRTNWNVRVLHEDPAGKLWIGSDVGLLVKDGEHFTRYTTRDGLLDDIILGIQDAPDGGLWLGTPKGLHSFREGRFRAFTTRDGLSSNEATPLLVEADGTIWVSTPAGLNRIRGREVRAVTENQGLLANAIFCLLDDGARHYWASSAKGIFRMRKSDLHAVADGRENRLHSVSYGEADGAISAEGIGICQPNACRASDGRMWFPTTRGVVVLAPSALVQKEVPPLVVVEEVLANDRAIFADGGPTHLGIQMHDLKSGMRVPAGEAGVVEIRYTANSFVAPEKVQFRYRLEGADSDWRAAGPRRVAFYTNLKPRSYRFRVEAFNREGVWGEAPGIFAFSIAPHLYETWPFYMSCGLAVVAMAAGLQGYRLNWQRRLLKLEEQRALANERTRIARDLHDDLGTALIGQALELDVLRREGAAPMADRLAKAAQSTRELAERMREVVWTINPRCDTVSSLANFLEEQVSHFLRVAGIQVRLHFPEDIPALPLDAESRHELALGLRESLSNVVRHSQASEADVTLAIEEEKLILRVKDNGRGFKANVEEIAGHGLSNLSERLKRIGGVAAWDSQPGGGTTVTFEVPLNRRTGR